MYIGDAMEAGNLQELQDQIKELRSRVALLEQAVVSHRSSFTIDERRADPEEVEVAAAAELPAMAYADSRLASLPLRDGMLLPLQGANISARSAETGPSLENRIGSQWFNRIGILAVLIAMAWFLKLAIDNHWIGPLGRVVIGLAAGAGLIVWSARFQRRGYAVFAYSLKALGSGILYLSLWAAFSLFHLVPSSVAFAAMIAVTAFNGYMSWVQDAELLAVYSIVGGLSTPLMLSTGENHEVSLFSYLLMLDIAVLVLVTLRPWSRLLFGAFAGTVLFVAGWWSRFYTRDQSGRTAFFLACFFLLFAFAPRLVRPLSDTTSGPAPWDRLAMVFMPLANAGLAFLAFYALFNVPKTSWAGSWLAVAFAAFYLLLLKLPARGLLSSNSTLSFALQLTTAVTFLTLAIPLKTHGRWLTIGWLVQGAPLLWIAYRVDLRLLRVLALLCPALGLGALFLINAPASITPLLNERFGTYSVAIAIFVFVALLARSARPNTEEAASNSIPWSTIAPLAALLVNVLILVAISWEIHGYWWFVRWHGNWRLMHDYRMYAQFTYSAFFMLFGAVLLGAGFWRHSAFVRWQALVLLAVAIAKVCLGDVSALSQGYRILSFLGLGVLLLAISFVYQRDLLHLRVPESENA